MTPHLLRVSVPRIRGYVNVYLISGGDGWTLIDSAEDSALSRTALFDFLERRGVLDDGISSIFLTHGHKDHTGLAEEIAALTGATTIAHESALRGEVVDLRFLDRHGLPEGPGEELTSPPLDRLCPSRIRLVGDGDILEAGPYVFRLLWTPGHQRGHLCGFDEGSGLLLSGDRLLRAPIGIGLFAENDADLLAEHLGTFDLLAELPVTRVLPGHGSVFTTARAALDEDRRSHLEDVRVVFEAIPTGGTDASTIARRIGVAEQVRPGAIGRENQIIGLARVLAALRFLERRGSVRRDEATAPVRFERAAASYP